MRLLLCVLFLSLSIAGFAQRKQAVCFIYHRFSDSRYPSTNTDAKTFETHLKWLKENKYEVLSFSKAIAYLKSSEPARKVAVLTIDDGYKSFYQNGLPLLKKYGMEATLFINSESVGGSDYMNWEQLRDVSKSGIEIGNHTHAHTFFMNLPAEKRYDQFRDELRTCQQLIRENLGLTPTVFSYPYGEYDEKMKDIVKSEGFIGAGAQNSGVMSNESDLFLCPRFPMSESYATRDKFIEKAKMNALPVTKVSTTDHLLPAQKKPMLVLTLDAKNLNTNGVQCFIQGSNCHLTKKESDEERLVLELSPVTALTKRRTLYTITIPDKEGRWYWYSFLWINPAVKD